MNWQAFLLNPAVIIPVSAILVGGFTAVYSIYCKHRERIAMIENGIHPDFADEMELVREPDDTGSR